MRSHLLVVVLALLLLTVSAVPVPFKSCGSSKDDGTIDAIVSNEYPPVKGDTLTLNVTGNLTKEVTGGKSKLVVSVDGLPVVDQAGDISAYRALPWPVGELNFTYTQLVPAAAPPGSYVVKISANDQDGVQIFCLSIAFALSAEQQPAQLTDTPASAIVTDHTRPVSSLRRLRPVHKQPAVRSLLV